MSAVRYKCCACCEGPDGVDPDAHAEFGSDWHELGCTLCHDYRRSTNKTGEDQ